MRDIVEIINLKLDGMKLTPSEEARFEDYINAKNK
jgi:hypothetical protein